MNINFVTTNYYQSSKNNSLKMQPRVAFSGGYKYIEDPFETELNPQNDQKNTPAEQPPAKGFIGNIASKFGKLFGKSKAQEPKEVKEVPAYIPTPEEEQDIKLIDDMVKNREKASKSLIEFLAEAHGGEEAFEQITRNNTIHEMFLNKYDKNSLFNSKLREAAKEENLYICDTNDFINMMVYNSIVTAPEGMIDMDEDTIDTYKLNALKILEHIDPENADFIGGGRICSTINRAIEDAKKYHELRNLYIYSNEDGHLASMKEVVVPGCASKTGFECVTKEGNTFFFSIPYFVRIK